MQGQFWRAKISGFVIQHMISSPNFADHSLDSAAETTGAHSPLSVWPIDTEGFK